MGLIFLYMGWRIIYIEEADNLRLYLDNIKFEKDTTSVTIPLCDIHTLVIDNQKVLLTVPLINKCAEYNVNIIFCSLEHQPNALIQPFCGNYQSPLLLKKQINWDGNIKLEIHRLIIQNKIRNQIDLLKHLDKMRCVQTLSGFLNEVDSGDTKNREGLSAKMYFRELFGDKFKRFDDDVINAGLNYGYSILRSQISKTLIAKGLNPMIGIIHIGYDNPFNLSDDIIELFRPMVDEYVYKKMRDEIIFKKQNRLDLIKLTTQDVNINGINQTFFNCLNQYIDIIIKIFETGELSLFPKIYLNYEL